MSLQDDAHPYAHYYLGICCALRERYEDAAEFFLHVLDSDGNNTDVLLALAKVYTITGQNEKAAQVIEQIKDSCGESRTLKSLRQLIRSSRFNSKIKTVSDTVKSVLLKNT